MRRTFLPALILLFTMFIMTTGARAQKGLPCGNEAEVARSRAQGLEAAAASCRRDLASGHSDCDINVQWRDLGMNYPIRLSIQEAETLASRLREFAAQIDTLDKQLAEARSRYEVETHGTYVTAGRIRCTQDTSVTVSGDRVTQCRLGCYRTYGIPYIDCWRDDIRLLGLCLFNNGLRLKACNDNCAKP